MIKARSVKPCRSEGFERQRGVNRGQPVAMKLRSDSMAAVSMWGVAWYPGQAGPKDSRSAGRRDHCKHLATQGSWPLGKCRKNGCTYCMALSKQLPILLLGGRISDGSGPPTGHMKRFMTPALRRKVEVDAVLPRSLLVGRYTFRSNPQL